MQGPLVDDLFNDNRNSRISANSALAERSPDIVGKERLKKFSRPLNQSHSEQQVDL